MENIHNQQNQDNSGEGPADQAAGAQANPQQYAGRCVLDSLHSAIRRGANDARNAAEKALPKIKSAAFDAGYWVGYGVSFAAVFQWTVARSLAPECLKSGFRDGVKAGRETAEKWLDTRKRQSEHALTTSPAEASPVVQEAQPGSA